MDIKYKNGCAPNGLALIKTMVNSIVSIYKNLQISADVNPSRLSQENFTMTTLTIEAHLEQTTTNRGSEATIINTLSVT